MSYKSKEWRNSLTKVKSKSFDLESIPGALPPLGIFDPLSFGPDADENTLKRYREAEITHGRVVMLATVGFLAGGAVEGSSFLFDSSVCGPAITHLSQVPLPFWTVLMLAISYFELERSQYGWVSPWDVPVDQPGELRSEYYPGDLGFDLCCVSNRKTSESQFKCKTESCSMDDWPCWL